MKKNILTTLALFGVLHGCFSQGMNAFYKADTIVRCNSFLKNIQNVQQSDEKLANPKYTYITKSRINNFKDSIANGTITDNDIDTIVAWNEKIQSNKKTNLEFNSYSLMANESSGTSASTGGIPSQQEVLFALADFVADRFKSEIESNFLESLNKEMDKYKINYVLPKTASLLANPATINYMHFGSVFGSAIQNDFNTAPTNIVNFLGKWDSLFSPTEKEIFPFIKSMNELYDKLYKGERPSDVFTIIEINYKGSSDDVAKVFEFIDLINRNLIDQNGNWISLQKFNSLCRQYPTSNTSDHSSDFAWQFVNALIQDDKNVDNVLGNTAINKFQDITITVERIENVFNDISSMIRQFGGNTAKLTNDQYNQYILSIKNVVDTLTLYSKTYTTINPAVVDKIRLVTDNVTNIYMSAKNKDYGAILQDLKGVISVIPSIDSTISNEVLNIGSLFVDILSAKDDKGLENIIESYTLPAGSGNIKRQSIFTLSLNAYAGVNLSNEYIPLDTKANAFTPEFTAPIGIDLSWGIKNQTWYKLGAKSFGLYFPIIDIGALTAFRLTNNSTYSSNPDINFRNVLAPGMFLVFGYDKIISLGLGSQLAPQLSSFNGTNATINSFGIIRIGGFLAIDIPLFTLSNIPNANPSPKATKKAPSKKADASKNKKKT